MSSLNLDDWQPFALLNELELDNILFENELLNQNYAIDSLNQITFNQFSLDVPDVFRDLDPDVNFFPEIRDKCDQCGYHFVDSLNNIIRSDNLSICSLNVNSISKNFDCFTNTFFSNPDLDFDVVGLCESKLTDEIANIFEINNYSMLTMNNKRNKGGLLFYINQKLKSVTIRKDISIINENIEVFAIEIKNQNESFLCVLIYHSPSSNKQIFLNDIENLIGKLSGENKKT